MGFAPSEVFEVESVFTSHSQLTTQATLTSLNRSVGMESWATIWCNIVCYLQLDRGPPMVLASNWLRLHALLRTGRPSVTLIPPEVFHPDAGPCANRIIVQVHGLAGDTSVRVSVNSPCRVRVATMVKRMINAWTVNTPAKGATDT